MNFFDKITMNCIVYMVNCNYVTHATCMLTFMLYKYNDLQMSNAIQRLSCKANWRTPLFFIVINQNFMFKEVIFKLLNKATCCPLIVILTFFTAMLKATLVMG